MKNLKNVIISGIIAIVMVLGLGLGFNYSFNKGTAHAISPVSPVNSSNFHITGWEHVNWSAVEHASGYQLEIYEHATEQDTLIFETQTTATSVKTAFLFENGKSYVFKIKALGDGVNYTDSGYFQTDPIAAISGNGYSFTNVAINNEGILSYDAVGNETNLYWVGFYKNGQLVASNTTTETTMDIAEFISGNENLSATTLYNIQLRGYKYTNGLLADPHSETYTIENFRLVTPEEPAAPATTEEPVVEEAHVQKGLSGGAIAGIVIASVVVAAVGGCVIFWFVIKKKTWADFVALFKKN